MNSLKDRNRIARAMQNPTLPLFNNISLVHCERCRTQQSNCYSFTFRQHEYCTAKRVLFVDSSDKRFSPFHPTETTFRSDAMPRSPKQTSSRRLWKLSYFQFASFSFIMFIHEKKERKRTIAIAGTTYTRTDNKNNRRVITVSYFPRYSS